MKTLVSLLFVGLILTLGCSKDSDDSGPAGVANNAPVIQSVNASPGEVSHEGSSSLVCIATDADRDTLTYSWMTRVGSISADGAEAVWTAPWDSGTYFIKVIVSDGVAIVADSIQVVVLANRPPIITSLSSSSGEILRGGLTSITCTATDEDEDNLSYVWTSSSGTIQGSGSIVQWRAPQASGTYRIKVVVSDGYYSDSDSIQVFIAPNRPPTISNLIANPMEVVHGGSSTLTCTASDDDGDNLSYTWTAQSGSFRGSGTSVLWEAPATSGVYWIKVAVDDGYDVDTDSVQLTVVPPNLPPARPYDPFPTNGESNAPTSLTLTWRCVDPDGDPITYDFYFGDYPPSLILRGLQTAQHQMDDLSSAVIYYWKIAAHDNHGNTSVSDTWHFSTHP